MSWKVDTTQKKAAWSLYVELATRIAVQPLEVDQGLVREAMNSLYSVSPENVITLTLKVRTSSLKIIILNLEARTFRLKVTTFRLKVI